jgi:hypothetical protein
MWELMERRDVEIEGFVKKDRELEQARQDAMHRASKTLA